MDSPTPECEAPLVSQQTPLSRAYVPGGIRHTHLKNPNNIHDAPQEIKHAYSFWATQQDVLSAAYPLIQNQEHFRECLRSLQIITDKLEMKYDKLDDTLVKFGTDISDAVENESLRVDAHSSRLLMIEKETMKMDEDDRRLRNRLTDLFKEINQAQDDYRKTTDAKIEALTKKLEQSEERNKRMDELEARLNQLAARDIHVNTDPKVPVWVEVEKMSLEEQD